MKITATFVKKEVVDAGLGQRTYLHFKNAKSANGKLYAICCMKQSSMMQQAWLVAGKKYEFEIDKDDIDENLMWLPAPTMVQWDNTRLLIKGNNNIVMMVKSASNIYVTEHITSQHRAHKSYTLPINEW